MFALVDANAFYCSAEQVFRPDWRGKAIVVLSNNDGCIVAANRQAKALGIQKFVPYFQMRDKCEQKGVIVCSSNYEFYADLSAKMMQVIGSFAPRQHIYSIDESFLDFSQCQPSISCFLTYGQKIRQALWKQCRLPVCVGFGCNLTLAKLANHMAKKIQGYHGVYLIDSPAQREAILAKTKTCDIWGIGYRVSQKLSMMGITTGLQLAKMPPAVARRCFNVEIERVIRELNGEECKNWSESRADKQQIFSTRSVGKRITSLIELQEALCKHANIAAFKARKQASLSRLLLCFAHSSPFDKNPVNKRAIYRFPCPTADAVQITKIVFELAATLYQKSISYYKVGVGLLDLCSNSNEQGDLFSANLNNLKLMQIYDELNHRYGRHTLFLAAQGISPSWSMKRQYLSPQYTTRWQDLPLISCRL